MSQGGHRHRDRGRASVQLHEGQLTSALAGPGSGPATRYRLRPSVEVFPASDGRLYLLQAGAPDRAVADPTSADVALLERLARGPSTFADLESGLQISAGDLARKLTDLETAGLLMRLAPAEEPLPAEDLARFDRQLPYLAEIGDAVALQRRLTRARVVVLGCGGLGSWALSALACAGVRRFVLVDDDVVEPSNLNRQILYGVGDVGRSKVACAAAWLRRFEPRAEVQPVERRMRSARDLRAVVAGADALVHAADWPPYEIMRWADAACRSAGVPYITAGQVPPVLKVGPTYVPGRSACFACHERTLRETHPLFGELADHRRDHPTPATTLGPASGLVGTLLAMEVMHLLVGDAPVATEGRALLIDMRTLQMRWEAVERRGDCSACNHLAWHGGREPGDAGSPDTNRQGAVAPAAAAVADGLHGSCREPT